MLCPSALMDEVRVLLPSPQLLQQGNTYAPVLLQTRDKAFASHPSRVAGQGVNLQQTRVYASLN